MAHPCPDHFMGPEKLVHSMAGTATPLKHLSGGTSDHLVVVAKAPLAPLRTPTPAKVPGVSKLELGEPGVDARIKLHRASGKATKIILGWRSELPSGATREKLRERKPRRLVRDVRTRHSEVRGHKARAEMDRDAKLTRDTLEVVLTDLGIIKVSRPKKRGAMTSKSVKSLLQQRMAADRSVSLEQSKPHAVRDKKEVDRLKKLARKSARKGAKLHRRDRIGSHGKVVSEGMEHLASGYTKRSQFYLRKLDNGHQFGSTQRGEKNRQSPGDARETRFFSRVFPVGSHSHAAHGSKTPRFGGAQVRSQLLLRLPLAQLVNHSPQAKRVQPEGQGWNSNSLSTRNMQAVLRPRPQLCRIRSDHP